MDNSYYTGATLIRASASGGGGIKYLSNLPLAGPPLLMQPNILTGAPLIRNGQQATNGPGHQTQPGIICCFQPIYYIPNLKSNGAGGSMINFNNSNKHCINKPAISPRIQNQNQPPKRKNYKTLQKLKPIQNNSEDQLIRGNGMELYRKSSLPDPISPPAKTVAYSRPRRESSSSSSTSSSSSSSAVNSPTHFFTNSIESTKDSSSNEEKQRNDKLLNFYFYEEHWRPKDCDEPLGSNHQLDNGNWEIRQKEEQEQQNFNCCSVNNPNLAMPIVKNGKQQKDLEVEAQIVTLANGHRDLEIRLCYVTS